MNIKSSVAVACVLPGQAKDLSAPLYNTTYNIWTSTAYNILTLRLPD